MRRALRWLLTGTLLLAVMIGATGLTVLYGASPRQIERVAQDNFSEATGLVLKIDGGFKPVLTPVPGWHLGAISVSDPEAAADDPPLLAAKDAWLTLAPEGLLQGTFKIGALRLENSQITLPVEGDEIDGFSLPKHAPAISFLRLHNAEISIGQQGSEGYQHASLEFASLDYAGAKRPMRIALRGLWRTRAIDATAKITSPDRITRGDWVFAEAKAQIDGDAIGYSGRFKPDLAPDLPPLAGNVTARIANPAGALSWLIQAPPNNTLINLSDLTLEGRVETLSDRLLLRTRWAGNYFGTRLSLDATLRGGADWRETGAGDLNAVARAGGLFSSYLNGSFARDQGVSGDLSLSVLDLPGMFDAQIFPPDYRLTNAKNGSVKGRLSATTQGFALADARLLLGNEAYAGDAAIDLRGERPVISLGTDLADLILDPWVDSVLQGKQPLTRILPNLDADLVLEVNAQMVRYRRHAAGPMTASISTRPDALELDLRQLDLAGGVIAGNLGATPTSSIAKLDLTGAEIDTAQLIGLFGLSGVEGILGGSFQAQFPFPPGAQGWTGLQADGTVSLYQARLDGVDFRTSEAGPGVQSDLAQADFDFTIEESSVEATRIELRDALGSSIGTGMLDIATGSLAAEITPEDSSDGVWTLGGTLGAPTINGTTSAPAAEAATIDQLIGSTSGAGADIETLPDTDAASVSDQTSTEASRPAQARQTRSDDQGTGVANPQSPTTEFEGNAETGGPSVVARTTPGVIKPPDDTAEITQAEVPAEDPEATGPQTSPLPTRPKR